MLVPICALGFFCLTSTLRIRRVEYVTAVGGAAPAGEWRPRLIVPGHHNESYEWLDQARQMFAHREWRVRFADYENAPVGRDVNAASPYRWWLGLVAGARHEVSGSPMGPSVEWAALVADPLLMILLGACAVGFVARRFGVLAAALLSAGLVTLFPLASEFLPGAPDARGLSQLLALWSVLPLLAGTTGRGGGDQALRTRRWFFGAGVLGGIGLWINVAWQAPILAGIAVGGLLEAWISRADTKAAPSELRQPLPWRAWALGGAVTSLGAYLIEYFPSHMGSWELHSIHPLFGIAWMGGGELLWRLAAWIQGAHPRMGLKGVAVSVLAALALASVPVTLGLTHSSGFLMEDLSTMRLSLLPEGASAPNLWSWLLQNGFTPMVWATVLPLLLVVPAVAILAYRAFGPGERAALALALGPVLVAFGFAVRQLSWWNGVDSSVLALLVVTAGALASAPKRRWVAWVLGVLAAVALMPGAVRLWPTAGPGDALAGGEAVSLVERDLAYWLAQHVGQGSAVVLAPPNATTALYYYGGLRGLGTFAWESRDGIRAAVRIVSALTPEEAQELITRRGITHIVIPLWDPYMDAYARVGEGQVGSTFLERLHLWNLPPWLQPIPYLPPSISGFEGQSVDVLEVVDEQDNAMAASRLAEYFIDMGQMDLAASSRQVLRRFPADLGALLAQAQVAIALNDSDEFARTADLLVRRIGSGADQALPWDQRVGLAVVLAQAHHVDLARGRLKQCLDEMDEEKLRTLSTSSLYRLQVLRKALGLAIKDPRLQGAAMELLPADLRERLQN